MARDEALDTATKIMKIIDGKNDQDMIHALDFVKSRLLTRMMRGAKVPSSIIEGEAMSKAAAELDWDRRPSVPPTPLGRS